MAAGLLGLLLAAAAEAETAAGPKPVEVQFTGPSGCSGERAFFDNLRLRTANVRPAAGDEPRTTLQVRLNRERGRVVGELRTVDAAGATETRRVQGASCDDVVQALSLTAALALDPSAILTAPPTMTSADASNTPPSSQTTPTRTGEKPPEPVAGGSSGPLAPPVPVTRSRPVPRVEGGAEVIGLAPLSDDFSPGIALALFKNVNRGDVFSPALGLTLLYVRNDLHRSPEKASAVVLAGGAVACPVRLGVGFLAAQPCVQVLAGLISAAGRGLTYANRVDHLWLSVGGTVRLTALLGRGLSLVLEGGLGAPLYKRRYFATVPSNVIAETPTLSPLVGLGFTYAP